MGITGIMGTGWDSQCWDVGGQRDGKDVGNGRLGSGTNGWSWDGKKTGFGISGIWDHQLMDGMGKGLDLGSRGSGISRWKWDGKAPNPGYHNQLTGSGRTQILQDHRKEGGDPRNPGNVRNTWCSAVSPSSLHRSGLIPLSRNCRTVEEWDWEFQGLEFLEFHLGSQRNHRVFHWNHRESQRIHGTFPW